MPVPKLNPTLDAGLAVAVLRLYKLSPDSPPSTTGLAGFGTNNGSWGAGLFTKNYIMQDRIRLTEGIGHVDLNLNFYGVGFGARWVASEEHGVRLSVDLAWAEGDATAYFYIGESF
jgi:hypothetical protein